jgi:DNA repair protein RadC
MAKLNASLADDLTGHREWLIKQFLAGDSTPAEEQKLELLLSYSMAGEHVVPVSRSLITTFGCLDRVLRADSNQLLQVPGVGESSGKCQSI